MCGIAYWIEKRARITPTRQALVGEERTLTYDQMSKEIQHIGCKLKWNYRLNRGDRIAVLSTNSLEYVTLLFAAAELGLIVVPLNIRLSLPELDYQVKDSSPRLLIVSREYDAVGRELVLCRPQMQVIGIDELWHDDITQNVEVETSGRGSDPFLICYTSGTTGRPKGAILTQDNMFWNALNNIFALDLSSADRAITLLPLFHIGGIGLFTFPVLLAGGTVVIPDRFQPDKALSLIEQHQVTIVMGVPTMHAAMLQSERFPRTDLSSVRWFYNGGAPCPTELIQEYQKRGIRFGQGYGLTETSPTVCMLSQEDCETRIGSIGKPAMFCEVKVMEGEDREVPVGEVGELWVRGPNVFQGYWNLPVETQNAFHQGWFRTGDLVRCDDDGFLYVVGRKKEMIISGGENVYPLEVEQVISSHPAVQETAVFGVPDKKWGEVPMAIVVLKPRRTLSESELSEFCRERLAKYKCPKYIHFTSEIPKNATGKIDKVDLVRRYTRGLSH